VGPFGRLRSPRRRRTRRCPCCRPT
jgi:hypothetical protein